MVEVEVHTAAAELPKLNLASGTSAPPFNLDPIKVALISEVDFPITSGQCTWQIV